MTLLTEYAERTELGNGRFQHIAHIKPIAFRNNGTLQAIASTFIDSGDGTRPHLVSDAPIQVTVANDGLRRFHPTRDINKYLELGAPFIQIGGVWTQVSLGTPTRSAGSITWTRPQSITTIRHGGHFCKLEMELLGGFIPENNRLAFPVGLTGLTRSGVEIRDGGVTVARLRQLFAYDAANDSDIRPITHQFTNLNGQPYLLLTLPSLAGMSRPTIDPSLDTQPDATAGKDNQINSATATSNNGVNVTLIGGVTSKGLLEFDLSGISASDTCDDATLYLYQRVSGAASAFTVTARSIAVGNEAWTEGTRNNAQALSGESCWNARVADGAGGVTTAWSGSAGLATVTTDYESASLGSFSGNRSDANGTAYSTLLTASRIQGWFGGSNTNYGLLLTTSAALGGLAASDHTTAGERPRLVVNYTSAAGGQPIAVRRRGSITPIGAQRIGRGW